MKTFNDVDRCWLNSLSGVQKTRNVVVDWLFDRFSILNGLGLLVHQVEVVSSWVERGNLLFRSAETVQAMIVIKANNGSKVRKKGVRVGISPFWGTGSPPNNFVILRMKVDFPHPESAARP